MYLQKEFAALRSCQKRGGMGIGVSGGIRRVYLDPMDVFASFFAGERRDPFASMAFGVTENQRQQEQAGCSSFGGSTPHGATRQTDEGDLTTSGGGGSGARLNGGGYKLERDFVPQPSRWAPPKRS